MRTKLALSISGVLAVLLSATLLAKSTAADPAPDSLFLKASSLANEAIARLSDGSCAKDESCDPLTGCIIPPDSPEPDACKASPNRVSDNVLDEPPDCRTFKLQFFHACRGFVRRHLAMRDSDPGLFISRPSENETAQFLANLQFAAAVISLNGDIFWAPATKTTAPITQFGDEARAVFGPIPDIDCTDSNAITTHLEVDGNVVDLKHNTSEAGSPLEFEHRDPAGNFVKWTTAIPRCDKPTLAGGWKDNWCGF